MDKQKILDILINSMNDNDNSYAEIFSYIDENKNLKFNLLILEDRLKFDIMNDNIKLETAYEYCNKYNQNFYDEVNKCSKKSIINLTKYLLYNYVSIEEFKILFLKVFRNLTIESEEHMMLYYKLLGKIKKMELYEEIKQEIFKTKDDKLIVQTALVYDNSIIKEIFKDKMSMYIYIINKDYDEIDRDNYIDLLMKLNNNELDKKVSKILKNVDID